MDIWANKLPNNFNSRLVDPRLLKMDASDQIGQGNLHKAVTFETSGILRLRCMDRQTLVDSYPEANQVCPYFEIVFS